MRTLISLASLSILTACGAANSQDHNQDHHDDNGPKTSRSFSVSDFDGIVLAASDDVRVTEGAAFSVSATATQKVLDQLEFTVQDGVLKISRKRQSGSWNARHHDQSATISVTMPVIHSAAIAGSGNMQIAATAQDSFEGSIAGSGELSIAQVRAANTELSIAGSGDLTASGAAKQLDLNIAGSGDIDATKLQAEQLSASIAGSGDIRARATAGASASIIGSGDIEISGTNNCKISKVGSGAVRCTA